MRIDELFGLGKKKPAKYEAPSSPYVYRGIWNKDGKYMGKEHKKNDPWEKRFLSPYSFEVFADKNDITVVQSKDETHQDAEWETYPNNKSLLKYLKPLSEGWFSKKKKHEPQRTDFTLDERDLIHSVFKGSGHNIYMKYGGEKRDSEGRFVLSGNITVNHGIARMNFHKWDDQIVADVGWYSDESGPGNPRVSPLISTDVKINSKEDLIKLKKEAEGGKE